MSSSLEVLEKAKAQGHFLPLGDGPWEEDVKTPEDIAFVRSAIKADDEGVARRIREVRERAYAVFPFPCIRGHHFVKLASNKVSVYKEIVEAGKRGESIYIDLGCCMGTDVRKLVADGYPAKNVYGCDLYQGFIDCGHQLFDDASACPIQFFTQDIFEHPHPPPAKQPIPAKVTSLSQLVGHVDHVYTGEFFHLFNEERQYGLALRVAALIKRKSGDIIYGRHWANCENATAARMGNYLHTPETWEKMWKKVFTEVESAEFAEARLQFEEAFLGHYGKAGFVGISEDLPEMFWSVKVI